MDAEQIAQGSIEQGRFNLIDTLRNRNMPEDNFEIYLDEASEWKRQALLKEHSKTTDPDRLAELDEELAAVEETLRASKAVITLRAITSKRYDELIADAKKKYPVKYEKAMNPLTGRQEVNEVASSDREEYFDEIYLADVIVRAEFDGAIDENIDHEWVVGLMEFAPVDALRIITGAAYKMRMATAWMDELQSEDFSPRS